MKNLVRMRLTTAAAALLVVACVRPTGSGPKPSPQGQATSEAPDTAVFGGRILTERSDMLPSRPGEIGLREAREIAPRVASVRALPPVLYLRVGDTLTLTDTLRLMVLDSSGAELGRLVEVGKHMVPGAAMFVFCTGQGLGVTGRYAGKSIMRLEFPRVSWVGRSDSLPGADLRIVVTDRP